MKLAFDIRFNYGDVLYNIMEIEKDVVCTLCKGQGALELVVGGRVTCVTCKGRKEIPSDTFTWKVMLKSKMIGVEINVFEGCSTDVCISGEALSKWGSVEDTEGECSSHNFFNIDDCFASLEEAEAECQRRNQSSDKKEKKPRQYLD